jgi:hypothetical protein
MYWRMAGKATKSQYLLSFQDQYYHMRRSLILFCTLLLVFIQSFSQQKEKSIAVYTSLVNDNFFAYPHVIGGEAKADETGFLLLGMEYSWKLKKNISLNAGVEFAKHTITVSYWMDNPNIPQLPDNKGQLQLITIPVSLRLSFLKYFFFQTGVLLDKQVKNNIYNRLSAKDDVVNDQSGIGALVKLGGQYRFKKHFTVFTGLYTEVHGLIFFNQPDFKKRLIDGGLRTGVQYRF